MLRAALGGIARAAAWRSGRPTAAAPTATAAALVRGGGGYPSSAAAAAVGVRQQLSSSSSAAAATGGQKGGKAAGVEKMKKKSQADIFKDFEASLDANELRPMLAENADELLREAAEAIPYAPGYRGSRRKKRQRERLRVVRRGDYVRKLQVVARHEERMQARSSEAINGRLARLGLPPLPKKEGKQQQEAQAQA